MTYTAYNYYEDYDDDWDYNMGDDEYYLHYHVKGVFGAYLTDPYGYFNSEDAVEAFIDDDYVTRMLGQQTYVECDDNSCRIDNGFIEGNLARDYTIYYG